MFDTIFKSCCRGILTIQGNTFESLCLAFITGHYKSCSDFIRISCMLNHNQYYAIVSPSYVAYGDLSYLMLISRSKDKIFPKALCFQSYQVLDDKCTPDCIFHMQDGRFNGLCGDYYIGQLSITNQLCSFGRYVNDRPHGRWRGFLPNGYTHMITDWINGTEIATYFRH